MSGMAVEGTFEVQVFGKAIVPLRAIFCTSLPEKGESGKLYCVMKYRYGEDGTEIGQECDQYVWLEEKFERIDTVECKEREVGHDIQAG